MARTPELAALVVIVKDWLTVTATATVSLTVIAALVVIVTVIGTVCCYCYFDRDC